MAQSYTVLGFLGREYAVLLCQSGGNPMMMSPCARSTDKAVATKNVSLCLVMASQENILVDATPTPE